MRNAALLGREEARDQREQRGLAGAVQAEQHREARRRDAKLTSIERPPRAIGMADAGDRQGGRGCDAIRPDRGTPHRRRCVSAPHGGAIVMPQGSSPTWMDLITFCAATSITETSFETPLVTSRYFSSGVNAMCHRRKRQ